MCDNIITDWENIKTILANSLNGVVNVNNNVVSINDELLSNSNLVCQRSTAFINALMKMPFDENLKILNPKLRDTPGADTAADRNHFIANMLYAINLYTSNHYTVINNCIRGLVVPARIPPGIPDYCTRLLEHTFNGVKFLRDFNNTVSRNPVYSYITTRQLARMSAVDAACYIKEFFIIFTQYSNLYPTTLTKYVTFRGSSHPPDSSYVGPGFVNSCFTMDYSVTSTSVSASVPFDPVFGGIYNYIINYIDEKNILSINSYLPFDVSSLSAFGHEAEILLPFQTPMKMIKISNNSDNALSIELSKTKIPLLKYMNTFRPTRIGRTDNVFIAYTTDLIGEPRIYGGKNIKITKKSKKKIIKKGKDDKKQSKKKSKEKSKEKSKKGKK